MRLLWSELRLCQMASDESLVKSDESSSSGITWAHLPAGPPLRQYQDGP